MNEPYDVSHYTRRDRILSLLSKSCIVIELGNGKGTMKTVDYFLDQNKKVYALPGNDPDIFIIIKP